VRLLNARKLMTIAQQTEVCFKRLNLSMMRGIIFLKCRLRKFA